MNGKPAYMTATQYGIRTLLVCISFVFCCTPASKTAGPSAELALQKIKFDIKRIDENGLVGPPDGKVLIAYTFRIPLERSKRKEIGKIDPSIRFFSKPGSDQYTCIGEGATQAVLLRLAGLPYIERIDPFYAE
jgi:hypothetical protein